MTRLATSRSLLAIALAALALSACGGDDSAGSGAGGGGGSSNVAPIVKDIPAAQGGIVSDPDGHVTLSIPAGSLASDTEITLTITPKTSETATSVYAFSPAGLALTEPATLSISTMGVTVPVDQKATLAVQTDGAWVALPGSTEGSGGLQAPIDTLGTFSVIFVAAPAGLCDATCMGQAGAECCTTCGCQAAVPCTPQCAAPTQWDCEIGCCFDYDLQMCAP